MTSSIRNSMGKIISVLPRRRRVQLVALFLVTLISAAAELISLGAVFPFLAVLINPQSIVQHSLFRQIDNYLNFALTSDPRLALTVIFVAAVIFSCLARFLLIYMTARFNFGIGHELGSNLYRRAIFRPYEIHVSLNSSEVLGSIQKVDDVVWVIFSFLNMISAAIMALFIIIALMLVNISMTAITIVGLGSIYFFIFSIAKKRLVANSFIVNNSASNRIKAIQEGLGGIREIILHGLQDVFVSRFDKVDLPLRQAQASTSIIGPTPRFAVEALGMILIAFLAYQLSGNEGEFALALPAIGALALGIQRLMPLVQQSYQGWVQITGNRKLLDDIVGLLSAPSFEQDDKFCSDLSFKNGIHFKNVSYRYRPDSPLVLNNISFSIYPGDRVGIIGSTGSGKTTAVDLLMGLLIPTEGQIYVSGQPLQGETRRAWQRKIAHVPQMIYLADTSFSENIAFAVLAKDIQIKRVMDAARIAKIHTYIESQSGGYFNEVGERGVKLSGGQRQRVGIARALYQNSEILVFDEATSALDLETEKAVMSGLSNLSRDITMIIIAHRIDTLKNCTKIIRFEAGHIVKIGTYAELFLS